MPAEPSVAACYLYPVKGMTAHPVEALRLAPGASAGGDRAFVFAFADAERRPPHGWVSKRQSVTLLNTPELARICAAFDAERGVLSITAAGETRSAAADSEPERTALAAWFADMVRGLPDNPLAGHPEREPLALLGDGASRFTDRGPTQISLASRASLAHLGAASGLDVDMRRFRLNLALDGVEAWEEFDWVGKRVRIGEATLEVAARLQRCGAINADPEGGGRDMDLMRAILDNYRHLDFGVEANVVEGGEIRAGDPVGVLPG